MSSPVRMVLRTLRVRLRMVHTPVDKGWRRGQLEASLFHGGVTDCVLLPDRAGAPIARDERLNWGTCRL